MLAGIFYLFLIISAACRTSPEAVPPLITTAPPPTAGESLAALQSADIPARDLVELARLLGGVAEADRLPAVATPYSPGDAETFWFSNHDSGRKEQIEAHLLHQSPQLNLWVQVDEDVRPDKLTTAATFLEAQILPTNHTFFGSEWQPGMDGDPRLNILHVGDLGGNVAGLFSAADAFTTAVNPFSNERELLYTSLRYAPPGSDEYYALIAHELQHLIHWHADSNETTWLNEGMSVLAAFLSGYHSTDYEQAFATAPDVQLNAFSYTSPRTSAHYGAAFFLAAYFLDRFGPEATQSLLRQPEDGTAGITATLAELGEPAAFDDLFAAWVVANYLDSTGRGEGIYQYGNLDVPELVPSAVVERLPAGETNAVHQYAADYVQIESTSSVTLVFTGTRQTRVLDTMPHSGDYFWTTLPADSSDMRLTGAFDLSQLDSATLTFWTWYDIEEGWDYAYLTLSDDGGESWHILETQATTRENPHGNSYGPALTGRSGNDETPAWVQQQADLTPFVGRPVLIRFQYITDDAAHEPGWAIDDIAIPQLNFLDSVEGGEGLWQAEGFVRHSNVLPQSFIVQAVLLGEEEVRVEALALDEQGRGRWVLPLSAETPSAMLIIAANTPFTTQRASYAWSVVQNMMDN